MYVIKTKQQGMLSDNVLYENPLYCRLSIAALPKLIVHPSVPDLATIIYSFTFFQN